MRLQRVSVVRARSDGVRMPAKPSGGVRVFRHACSPGQPACVLVRTSPTADPSSCAADCGAHPLRRRLAAVGPAAGGRRRGWHRAVECGAGRVLAVPPETAAAAARREAGGYFAQSAAGLSAEVVCVLLRAASAPVDAQKRAHAACRYTQRDKWLEFVSREKCSVGVNT